MWILLADMGNPGKRISAMRLPQDQHTENCRCALL